jgi:hypothetical protein
MIDAHQHLWPEAVLAALARRDEAPRLPVLFAMLAGGVLLQGERLGALGSSFASAIARANPSRLLSLDPIPV